MGSKKEPEGSFLNAKFGGEPPLAYLTSFRAFCKGTFDCIKFGIRNAKFGIMAWVLKSVIANEFTSVAI